MQVYLVMKYFYETKENSSQLVRLKSIDGATNNCFCLGRWADEEEEEIERPKPIRPLGGVAIAPPPSLQESTPEPALVIPNKPQPSSSYGNSVAAKIMAR